MGVRQCEACDFRTMNDNMKICARCGEDFNDIYPDVILAQREAEEAENPVRDLDELSANELRELAKSMGHKGVSKMKKADLLAAVKGDSDEA